jgi:hypothetical protein
VADQTSNDMPFVAETTCCEAQMPLEVAQVRATDVTQLHVFEIGPDALIRVEIGRVARQLLESKTFGRTLDQEVFDGPTTMNRRTVPDHQQLAGNVLQQMLEEANHLGAAKRVVLHAQQQAPARGDTADDRQMVTRKRKAQCRWVAAWGQAADHGGQQGEARFVYPNDRAPLSYSPLFSAGQRSVRHCSMAASLR